MYQTGYKGYTMLSKGLAYNGGFCKWYYIAKEDITAFPSIDPATQFLTGEPAISGAWCGPVHVPNDTLGFEEPIKRDVRGQYYLPKISGFYPGDSAGSRINMENMPYHQFVVVGKMRAGGMYLVIGNNVHGLTFDADYKSAGNASAGTEFSFSMESLTKALILPSFAGDNLILPPGSTGNSGGSGGSSPDVEPEIFSYSSQQTMNIEWNEARRQRFGAFPTIEVWYTENGIAKLNTGAIIQVDAFPPDTTLFTLSLNAPGPGIVVLK